MIWKSKTKLKTAVLMAHGGVGDFLFQIDLAKRLELVNIPVVILIRKNFSFLKEIIESGNLEKIKLVRANSWSYIKAVLFVWASSFSRKIFIINQFYFTKLSLPTRIFYKVADLLSATVVLCPEKHNEDFSYKQITYIEKELIWQRSNRIVSYVSGKEPNLGFPVLKFKTKHATNLGSYIHIHPIASNFSKSYPPEELIKLLKSIGGQAKIVISITPNAESWYLTEELRRYLASRKDIVFLNKKFSFVEISSMIYSAKLFCTVNTGLLWLAVILGQKVVVFDTKTHEEWNPEPYAGVFRFYNQPVEKVAEFINLFKDGRTK